MADLDTDVTSDYVEALRDFYSGNREFALLRAYDAGRAAADTGVSMLDVVAAHHDELAEMLRGSAEPVRMIDAAAQVLAEFLASFEMAHRGYRDALANMLENHARLQAILQHLPALVSLHDPEGRYVMVNPVFEHVTGLKERDVRGRRDSEVLREGHPLLVGDRPLPSTDGATFDEVQIEQPDGTHTYLRVRFAVVDATGSTIAVCAISTDITDRTRAEAAVIAERDRADRSSAAKTKFISSMSHDMRTPLNAILGYAQLLAMDAVDVEQRSDIEEIARAGRHLLELINEAIDIGKIEEGELVLVTEPVELHDLVDETMALVRPLADKRGIQMAIDVSGVVLADRQRLERVVVNLLSNAIKYNRDRGTIRVATRSLSGFWRLEVTDTGMGLEAADVETLFLRFHRVNPGAHAEIEGSGLGLALCKNLIEAMDGHIGVESRAGSGSTFWVELPTAVPAT